VRAELEGRRCGSDDDCVVGYRCLADVCIDEQKNLPVEALASDDCPRLIGEDTIGVIDDERIADATQVSLVGVLLPLTRAGDPFDTGAAREEAVALGLTEVNKSGGVFGRSIVGVSCNSDGDIATAKRAAAHLASLGIPVVVGEQSSATTLQVFAEVLRPAGVLMLAPSATSVDLTTLPDDGLLARTTVSDARQGAVLGRLLVSGERVAVLAIDDSYGDTLLEGVRSEVCAVDTRCRDANQYREGRFAATPDDDEIDALAAQVAGIEPEFVAIIGQTAQVRPILERLGAANPTTTFVLTDAARSEALFTTPTPLPAALAARVIGTAPVQQPVGEAFDQLRGGLSPASADESFVAHAYDAAVVAGLLHAAVGDVLHPSGGALAARMSRLVAEEPRRFTIGGVAPGGVDEALDALEAGDVIDLEGTSGPLDFDANGDVSGDIELWRRCAAPSGEVLVSLGVALTAAGDSLPVELACSCTLVGVGCDADAICDADAGACVPRCDEVGEACTNVAGTPGACGPVGNGLGCR
jgi:branched-chain amino acid transport system substrate-binding protein